MIVEFLARSTSCISCQAWIRLHWKCLVDRIDGQLNSIHHSLEVAFRCARHDSQRPFIPKYSLQVPNKSFEVHPLGCTVTTQVLCRQHQISSSSCYCLQQCNIKEHPFSILTVTPDFVKESVGGNMVIL